MHFARHEADQTKHVFCSMQEKACPVAPLMRIENKPLTSLLGSVY
jgi:hypothetical protein